MIFQDPLSLIFILRLNKPNISLSLQFDFAKINIRKNKSFSGGKRQ